MKPITINVQISKCPKQYESIRLGGEWTVETGETVAEATAKAYAELNALYDELAAGKATAPAQAPVPQPQPQIKTQADNREHLQFDDKRVASIVKRLENAADMDAVDKIMEQVNKFYTYDENVGNVFYAATKF